MQYQLSQMISSQQWLDSFLFESNRRLHDSYLIAEATLNRLGIRFLPSSAAFFLWMDLTPFLPNVTVDAERSLWLHLIDHGWHHRFISR